MEIGLRLNWLFAALGHRTAKKRRDSRRFLFGCNDKFSHQQALVTINFLDISALQW